MTRPKPHERLAKRIQVLWMAVTGSDHPRGAYSWFARRVGVAPHTVRRWATGVSRPANFDSPNQPGAEKGKLAMEKLDSLEDEYGNEIPAARKRWRRYWDHKTEGEPHALFEKGR